LSSFRSTCPYHRNLFRCSTDIMSSNSSLPLSSLLGTLSCNFTPQHSIVTNNKNRGSKFDHNTTTKMVTVCCRSHIYSSTHLYVILLIYGSSTVPFHDYIKPIYWSAITVKMQTWCPIWWVKTSAIKTNMKFGHKHKRIHLKQNFRTCCWMKSKCSSL